MFKCEIKTGGAAYRDEENKLDVYEIKRSLKQIVERLENGFTSGSIIDINGNKVGKWNVE